MKRFSIICALILGLCAGKAQAAGFASNYPATTESITVNGVGVWATAITGSILVFQNTAGDVTDTLVFTPEFPYNVADSGLVVRKIRVYMRVRTAALDATPSFVVRRIYPGSSNAFTTATLTETESGCGSTVNTAYICEVTITNGYRIKNGEHLQIEMSVNNSATSVTQVMSYDVLTQSSN